MSGTLKIVGFDPASRKSEGKLHTHAAGHVTKFVCERRARDLRQRWSGARYCRSCEQMPGDCVAAAELGRGEWSWREESGAGERIVMLG